MDRINYLVITNQIPIRILGNLVMIATMMALGFLGWKASDITLGWLMMFFFIFQGAWMIWGPQLTMTVWLSFGFVWGLWSYWQWISTRSLFYFGLLLLTCLFLGSLHWIGYLFLFSLLIHSYLLHPKRVWSLGVIGGSESGCNRVLTAVSTLHRYCQSANVVMVVRG